MSNPCRTAPGRVRMWRGGLRYSLSVSAPFVWRCLNSRALAVLASPPSSNRACGFPAHGFPMFFTARHAHSSSLLLSALCRAHTSCIKCFFQFCQKRSFPLFDPDVPEGDTVNAGAPSIGTDKAIGMTEDVSSTHLVIQSIKAEGRVLLGLTVKLPL